MKLEQYKHTTAALVTLLGHLLLLLLLYLLYIERVRPLPQVTEVEIIPIEMLLAGEGSAEVSDPGSAEGSEPSLPKEQIVPAPLPANRVPLSTPSKAVEVPSKPKKPTALPQPSKALPMATRTQSHEESIIASEVKRQREAEAQVEQVRLQKQKEEEEEARLAAEQQRKAAEEQRQAEAARRANAKMASAFGTNARGVANATGSEQGGTSMGTGSSVGSGSHSLAGRSIISNGGRLSMPTIKKAIRGRINVRIIVDESGKVTSAEVSLAGTNIADAGVRTAAISAARQTEFNPQPGAGVQRGIITYNFEIQ